MYIYIYTMSDLSCNFGIIFQNYSNFKLYIFMYNFLYIYIPSILIYQF